jgi:hypothetical protein
MKKGLLVPTLIALLGAAATGSHVWADPESSAIVVTDSELQALAADNELFAATDLTSPTDPTGRQTISVSFFVGRIGPVSNGSAHWTNTESNDSDPFSVEIDIPQGGTPANGFSSFAGINFHHVPALAPNNPPAFDFMADKTAASGGSPRLVMIFSDGGNINLRPLAWIQDTWISEGTGNPTPDPLAATNWDNNGGTCGFLFEQTYATVKACHAAATVTAAFIVSDSGWLNAPYTNWIDNIQYNDQTISQPPDNSNS